MVWSGPREQWGHGGQTPDPHEIVWTDVRAIQIRKNPNDYPGGSGAITIVFTDGSWADSRIETYADGITLERIYSETWAFFLAQKILPIPNGETIEEAAKGYSAVLRADEDAANKRRQIENAKETLRNLGALGT
jgi:hypothetical protein